MKRIVLLALLLVFGLAAKFKDGDRVVAQYGGGEYWYAGKVTGQKENLLSIKFFDGSTDSLPSGHVRAFDWKAGTKISCKFKRGENWYPGTIKSVRGDRLAIKYDDGDEETTTLAYCRTKDE